MFIDTHAHLEMEQFDADRHEVIARAAATGVSTILDVGSSLEGSRKAVELARQYEFIHASVGIHPHESEKIEIRHMEELRELARMPKVVAIGETGLDYFKNLSPMETQQDLFRRHIQLAKDIGKPLIVHCRDAWEDVFSILKEEKIGPAGGIFHCFSGDKEKALRCVDIGFYVSFAGPLTYPKSGQLREAAKVVPSHRLFMETDAPYLAPRSHRGKRNEPAFVEETAKALAEIKGIHLEDLFRIMKHNLADLFGINSPGEMSTAVYQIRNSLYVNVTARCTNACDFCHRETIPVVAGHNLKLEKDPIEAEVISKIGDPALYDAVVFCGYGEPMLRLDFIKTVAKWIKERGGKVRINTNGQGNLIHGRDILPELKGLVDIFSISLNAENAEIYNRLCRSEFGETAYDAVKDFIRAAAGTFPEVVATVVRVPEVNVQKCEEIAVKELGAKFRVREFNVVG